MSVEVWLVIGIGGYFLLRFRRKLKQYLYQSHSSSWHRVKPIKNLLSAEHSQSAMDAAQARHKSVINAQKLEEEQRYEVEKRRRAAPAKAELLVKEAMQQIQQSADRGSFETSFVPSIMVDVPTSTEFTRQMEARGFKAVDRGQYSRDPSSCWFIISWKEIPS